MAVNTSGSFSLGDVGFSLNRFKVNRYKHPARRHHATEYGPLLPPVYIDQGKTGLVSDKIKLCVRKNLTAALCDIVGYFMKKRLIHVLSLMMTAVSNGKP